jgi:hypothetical protein
MFDQTNDAELFREPDTLKRDGFKLNGNRWVKGKQVCLPLYEAKMVQSYDHRAANVITEKTNWMRQGQTDKPSIVQYQNPEYLALPRYWINANEVSLPEWGSIGFKDITSPTNQRTMIAACGPLAGYTNHFVLLRSSLLARRHMCLLANLNSFVYDYCSRQKIGGVTLNYFIVEQVPMLPPATYDRPCPWAPEHTLEDWISERVLKLSCTAEDMLPLARVCEFRSGSFSEYEGLLNRWDSEERLRLMLELNAAYFVLYQLDRESAAYILSTFSGVDERNSIFKDLKTYVQRLLKVYDQFASPRQSSTD